MEEAKLEFSPLELQKYFSTTHAAEKGQYKEAYEQVTLVSTLPFSLTKMGYKSFSLFAYM